MVTKSKSHGNIGLDCGINAKLKSEVERTPILVGDDTSLQRAASLS